MSAAADRRSLLPVLAVPILVLFIPIFDTTFVTVLRKLSGRAASQGGRDHTSHRLVALGMSERHAVWMLYGFAALSGVLAILVQRARLDVSLAAIAGFTIVLTLVGVYLAGVKVYDESDEEMALKEKPLYAFLVDVSYKRRIFEVLLDVVLIILSYWASYAINFPPTVRRGTVYSHVAEEHIDTRRAGSKLAHVRFPEGNGAGIAKAANHRRILIRDAIAKVLGADRRRNARYACVVLVHDWNAVQRPTILACVQFGVESTRLLKRAVRSDRNQRIELWLQALDAPEIRLSQRRARE